MNKAVRGAKKKPLLSAFDDACRALGRRRLTETEVRKRLIKRHSAPEIEEAVAKLKEYRFLDDDALIVDYTKDRLNFSPRSARLIEFELSRRGIDPDHFRRVFEKEFPDYDEVEVARRALKTRLKRLQDLPKQGRRQRALRFLSSRGFSWDVISEVWREVEEEG
jgi:regulatory protein